MKPLLAVTGLIFFLLLAAAAGWTVCKFSMSRYTFLAPHPGVVYRCSNETGSIERFVRDEQFTIITPELPPGWVIDKKAPNPFDQFDAPFVPPPVSSLEPLKTPSNLPFNAVTNSIGQNTLHYLVLALHWFLGFTFSVFTCCAIGGASASVISVFKARPAREMLAMLFGSLIMTIVFAGVAGLIWFGETWLLAHQPGKAGSILFLGGLIFPGCLSLAAIPKMARIACDPLDK